MNARRARFAVWFVILTLAGCRDSSGPAPIGAPSVTVGGVGRPSVLVNPNAAEEGTAKTIQEGIDMVAEGGTVMVVPGTYPEAIVIDKGLTLEAIGGESGPVVVVAPPGAPDAIQVATSDPVIIRSLSVHVGTVHGIRAIGAVDLTVERSEITAVQPPPGISRLIFVLNDPNPSGRRARLFLRGSLLDGAISPDQAPNVPELNGLVVGGDVDAVLERNVIRRTNGQCIFIRVRGDLGGQMNVDILDNDLDECYPRLGGAIAVAPVGGNDPSSTRPFTAAGKVNIVGNTIRNTLGACRPINAITYVVFEGRVEHNRIEGIVQSCTTPSQGRARAAGIWLGSQLASAFFPPVNVTVRFNDIVGNAQAGLRLAPNMTAAIDASCNWWGSASGPSGVGPGSGDAVVPEAGAATPAFTPFATAPIAGTGATGC